MYKKVDTKLDFAGREPEVVKFWKDNDLIKKMIEKNKNGETYTFYEVHQRQTESLILVTCLPEQSKTYFCVIKQ